MKRLMILIFLSLPGFAVAGEYHRSNWNHWVVMEHGCFTTRDKVLAEESYVPVMAETERGGRCRVVAGLWVSPYTGNTITDASKLDIDHLVPLKEAWESGGSAWSKEEKERYANYLEDPNHLVAVESSLNRRKGAKDPAHWMPPNNRCWYVRAWMAVKKRWHLFIDKTEEATMLNILMRCPAK